MKRAIEAVLFSEEGNFCNWPYEVHKDKYGNYEKLLMELALLKGRGIVKSFEYDSLYKPYILHCVYVDWAEQNGYVELKAENLASLLKLCEGVIVDKVTGEWQLSMEIYREKK